MFRTLCRLVYLVSRSNVPCGVIYWFIFRARSSRLCSSHKSVETGARDSDEGRSAGAHLQHVEHQPRHPSDVEPPCRSGNTFHTTLEHMNYVYILCVMGLHEFGNVCQASKRFSLSIAFLILLTPVEHATEEEMGALWYIWFF